MYQEIKKNWFKSKSLLTSTIILALLLIIIASYTGKDKNQSSALSIIENKIEKTDFDSFKKFLLNQIKSPYKNVNYEIS